MISPRLIYSFPGLILRLCSLITLSTIIAFLSSCSTIDRPQTPTAPFEYIVKEIRVLNSSDNITLEGILTYPDRSKEFIGGYPVKTPVFILYSGSGPSNYDEEWLGHKPFMILADHLTRNGIAVLRLNDRDYKKDPLEFYQNTTKDFSRDLFSAVAYIKTNPFFEYSSIGLIGHSEGGIVSSMVAADNSDIDFLVLLGSPGVTLDKVTMAASRLSYELAGVPKSEIARLMEFHKEYNQIVKKYLSNKDVKAKAEKLYDVYFRGTQAYDQNARYNMATKVTLPWFRYMHQNDPSDYLKRVKCPVLAITGEFDSQVLPDQNLKAIENALIEAGNDNRTVVKMGNLNHMLQPADSYIAYAEIEETISIDLLNEVLGWINRVQLMLYLDR